LRPVIGATGTIHPGRAAVTLDASYGAWRAAIDMLIAQYGRAATGAGRSAHGKSKVNDRQQ